MRFRKVLNRIAQKQSIVKKQVAVIDVNMSRRFNLRKVSNEYVHLHVGNTVLYEIIGCAVIAVAMYNHVAMRKID